MLKMSLHGMGSIKKNVLPFAFIDGTGKEFEWGWGWEMTQTGCELGLSESVYHSWDDALVQVATVAPDQ